MKLDMSEAKGSILQLDDYQAGNSHFAYIEEFHCLALQQQTAAGEDSNTLRSS